MSTARLVALASLAVTTAVVACTAPSAPADASATARTARTAHARLRSLSRFGPLVACQDNTVEVNPCDGTDTLAKNSTMDTMTFHYQNRGTIAYDFEATCDGDGTVVLSCTPEDSIFEVPALHTVTIHYKVATRATAGTGSVRADVNNLDNDDLTGSVMTVVTQ
jgi:hypothetical protein